MNSQQRTFFTIVTATYNAEKTLPRLLTSLESQTCQDFILVIQDGASQDETIKVAEQWAERLSQISLESKKDTGIYEAWNRAIKRQGDSLGQWVLFLGADDELASIDVLEQVKSFCSQLPKTTLFAVGDLQFIKNGVRGAYKHAATQGMYQNLFYENVLHSALFSRKEAILSAKFNASYKIAGDYDWLRNIWKSPNQLTVIPQLITYMWEGGISSKNEYHAQVCKEYLNIMYTHRKKHPEQGILFWATFFYIATSPTRLYLKNFMGQRIWTKKIWFFLQKLRSTLVQLYYKITKRR